MTSTDKQWYRAPLTFKAIETEGGERIIAGTASVETVDHHGDLIAMEAFAGALDQFMKRPNLMAIHSSAQIGEVIPEFKDSAGVVHRTEVVGDIFRIVARVFTDLNAANEIWADVLNGTLGAFSIGGQALMSNVECAADVCFNKITEMDLFEVSIVDKPANQGAFFDIISKSLEAPAGEPCASGCGCDHPCDSGRCCMDQRADKIILLTKEAGREIQSLTLDPASFSLTKAVTWVVKNGFEAEFDGQEPTMDKDGAITFTQRSPDDFVVGSLVAVELRRGVLAVVGELMEGKGLSIGGGIFDETDKGWVADVVRSIQSVAAQTPTIHFNITPPANPRPAVGKEQTGNTNMTDTEQVESPVDTGPAPVTREEFDTLKGQVVDGFANVSDALTKLTDTLVEKAEEPEPIEAPPEPENTEVEELKAKLAAEVEKNKALNAPAKDVIVPAPVDAPTAPPTMTWRQLKEFTPMLGNENGTPLKNEGNFATGATIYKSLQGGA